MRPETNQSIIYSKISSKCSRCRDVHQEQDSTLNNKKNWIHHWIPYWTNGPLLFPSKKHPC